MLFHEDDGVIIGTRDIATRHVNGRWLQIYTDGRIETGILWGEDVLGSISRNTRSISMAKRIKVNDTAEAVKMMNCPQMIVRALDIVEDEPRTLCNWFSVDGQLHREWYPVA